MVPGKHGSKLALHTVVYISSITLTSFAHSGLLLFDEGQPIFRGTLP